MADKEVKPQPLPKLPPKPIPDAELRDVEPPIKKTR